MDKLKELLKSLAGEKYTEEIDGQIDDALGELKSSAIAEETAGLIKKRDELLKENKKLKERSRTTAENPDVNRLQDQLEELAGTNEELKSKLETATAEAQRQYDKLNKQMQKDVAKLTEERDAKHGALDRVLRNDNLRKELVRAGVKKELLDGAHAMLYGKVKVVPNDKGDFDALVEDKPLNTFIDEWALSDQGKNYVAAPVNGGGGAHGGNGSGGDAKSIKREAFDALSPSEKSAYIKGGGKITD